MSSSETNPVYGPFFGVMGAASAIIFSCKYNYTHLTATISIYPMTGPFRFFKTLCRARTRRNRHFIRSSQLVLGARKVRIRQTFNFKRNYYCLHPWA